MAEIGNGYGSEFQLMRFLGHHRDELEFTIKNELKEDGEIKWLDFPYDSKRKSGDSEYVGLEFLKNDKKYKAIKENWKKIWPSANNAQNWDAVAKIGEKWLLIEAKAHKNEIFSDCKASKSSKNMILESMKLAQRDHNIKTNNDWLKIYYQKANRLLFAHFLEKNDIKSSLLYIYFINGYLDKGVKSKAEWKEIIKEEDIYLGIKNNKWIKEKVKKIFIDCKA
jgi:hypothetical protein